MTVYLNGQYLPLEEARISPMDRGFLFGDGAYEVIPVYSRRPFRLAQHLARLGRTLEALRLANPLTPEGWGEVVARLVETDAAHDQGVYLQVTRGVAPVRDQAFPKPPVPPTVFAFTAPLPTPSAALLASGGAAVTVADYRWLRCDLKTTSLVGNVLMRQLAADADAIETVMFRDGWLTEASASNVLIVTGGVIVAPPKDNLILPGPNGKALMEAGLLQFTLHGADTGRAHLLVGAQYPLLLQHDGHQLTRYTLGALCIQHRTADELTISRFEGDGPGKPRLQRRDVFVHILAVEVHAGFEA